jgi:hypothetical protein
VDLRAPLVAIAAFCACCGGIATSDPINPGGTNAPDAAVGLWCTGDVGAGCTTSSDCVSLVARPCCGAYRVVGAATLAMCAADSAPACPRTPCTTPPFAYATDDGRAARTLTETRVQCENGGCRTSAQCDDAMPCANDSICVRTCGSAWCTRIPAGCVIGSDACARQVCDGVIGIWLSDRATACMIPCIVGVGIADAEVGDTGIH